MVTATKRKNNNSKTPVKGASKLFAQGPQIAKTTTVHNTTNIA